MKNKINTFDKGLEYLHQAKKQRITGFFAQTKIDMFRYFLGHIGGIGKLFHRKTADNATASREAVHQGPEKAWQSPFMILAYVACISFIAGAAGRKILRNRT